MAKRTTTSASESAEASDDAAPDAKAASAEQETNRAEKEGKLPETMAVTDPSPAAEMDSASGAFIEPEIKKAIPADHPAIDNNPRARTSAVQNGGDFNDPRRRHPSDPAFVGQGLDLSVYGDKASK